MQDVFAKLLNRPENANKYDFGHVLVIGGSPGMVGAPYMAGLAALKVGAGLVTIASIEPVISKLEKRTVEIMTLSLPDYSEASITKVNRYIKERRVSVIVFGPGLQDSAAGLLQSLIGNDNIDLIVDGGGLGILKDNIALLDAKRLKPMIITPHLGEFQRFFSKPLPKTETELIKTAEEFALKHKLILVLKGHPTHVFDTSGQTYMNTTGGPTLAKAGSGDVLAGMIAGILAQGITPSTAAQSAVYLHGLAGDIAAAKKTEPAVIASDLIDGIPEAFRLIQHQNK
jgi:hydroxyethylthiazole kinase-like uncharacterized protein yjeF